jgi:hypothetical protein
MKPCGWPFAKFSCMPEANLFLMFTRRLNTLGVAYFCANDVIPAYERYYQRILEES